VDLRTQEFRAQSELALLRHDKSPGGADLSAFRQVGRLRFGGHNIRITLEPPFRYLRGICDQAPRISVTESNIAAESFRWTPSAKGPAKGRPGYARVNLGTEGRFVQVLVEPSGSLDQVHVTFFDADGQQLDIAPASMSSAAPSGETIEVPIAVFEPGHFEASMDLEAGDWTFRLQGVASDDLRFDE
jgi:hypothetical protein